MIILFSPVKMRFRGTNEIISSPRPRTESIVRTDGDCRQTVVSHRAVTAKKRTFYFIDGRTADHFPPRCVTHS